MLSKFPSTKLLSTISKNVLDPDKKSITLKFGSTFRILVNSISSKSPTLDFNVTTFEFCHPFFC